MFSRRLLLAAAAMLPIMGSAFAADEWKSKYPELVFAVIPSENA